LREGEPSGNGSIRESQKSTSSSSQSAAGFAEKGASARRRASRAASAVTAASASSVTMVPPLETDAPAPLLRLALLLALAGFAPAAEQAAVDALKRLFLDEAITAAQYEEGKRLVEADATTLSAADARRRKVYLDLATGRLPSEYLRAVLDSIRPEELDRAARIAALLAAAKSEEGAGNWREAVASLEALLRIDPAHAEALALRDRILEAHAWRTPSFWLDRARRTVEEATELADVWAAVDLLAPVLARSGDLAGAVALGARIADARGRDELVAAVVEAAAGAPEAEAHAEKIGTDLVRARAYLAIALARHRKGDTEGARKALERSWRSFDRPGPEEELAHARRFLGRFAAALEEMGDATGARRVAGQIPEQADRDEALLAIARVRATRGDGPGARALLDLVPEPYRKPRVLAEFAVAAAEGGDVAGARMIPPRIEEPASKARAYGAIARAAAAAGRRAEAREAIELARRALGRAGAKDPDGEARACLAIAAALDAMGETAEASGFFERARAAALRLPAGGGIRETLLVELCDAQAARGDLAAAKTTMEATTRTEYRAKAIHRLARAYARAGQVEALARWIAVVRGAVERCAAEAGAAEGLLPGGA
jgi:hypothetical protein